MSECLLEVKALKVHFPVKDGPLTRGKDYVRAVDEVSFTVAPGETVGLVGESGCGKTTLGRAVIRLIEPTDGQIVFEGEDLTKLNGAALREQRRKFQMIFQDPYSSLNPWSKIESIIGEALDIHHLAQTRAARRQRVEQARL